MSDEFLIAVSFIVSYARELVEKERGMNWVVTVHHGKTQG
jgi:hypothetical protein